jgi:uncharacterized protein (TIGR03437 family)
MPPFLRISSLLLLVAGVALSQTPVVNTGGVVNAASFDTPVSPGSLVAIFGSNLAPQTVQASTVPLTRSLVGVSVQFNGIAAPLLFVSSSQINAQIPWEVSATDPVSVVVTNGQASSIPRDVSIRPYSPGVFASQGYAIAILDDGSLAAPIGVLSALTTRPAAAGDTLEILATGLGPTAPAGITGDNSLDILRNTATPVVSIGGVPAQVTFSGLSPQFVGVDQINVVIPANAPTGNSLPVEIQIGGLTSSTQANLAIGSANWTQWSQNPQHAGSVPLLGQKLGRILADVLYDPIAAPELESYGELPVHYQTPLVDGSDVFMEFKSGSFVADSYAGQSWGETRFTWQGNQLTPVWSYSSDWRPPGTTKDFFEPVFHAVVANGVVYVPGASGSIVQLDRETGEVVRRIAPFGSDPNTYETGPISTDEFGNVYYNALQVSVSPTDGFYANDATDSWLVRVARDGSFATVSYKALTSAEAPDANASCVGTFTTKQLPWPPSPNATPGTSRCGTQRVGLNVAPAIAPDGTIYSVTRAQFNGHYSFLVAISPDLSKKWVVSLRGLFADGCGVAVADGGWLPANGAPGGCAVGAPLGVDPSTNLPGDGLVVDSSSASPTVAPDGSVLYGSYSRYNYGQGHLVHFDADGNYLGAFGFGWDITPAIYSHNGTWSAVIKDNHYGDLGSYCNDKSFCPEDRTATNPSSPEAYFVRQLNRDLVSEWSFQNTNVESCSRAADGTLTCAPDHPLGFEWCVNAPAVDANGVVYANSEDGNLYAIGQGGVLNQSIFQQLALGAAYTPASLDSQGRIYTQNDGHLFVVGK